MAKKQKDEEEFSAAVMANPDWKAAYGERVGRDRGRRRKATSRVKEQFFHSTDSHLCRSCLAHRRVCGGIKKPTASGCPASTIRNSNPCGFSCFRPRPIYPAMEIARMAGALDWT